MCTTLKMEYITLIMNQNILKATITQQEKWMDSITYNDTDESYKQWQTEEMKFIQYIKYHLIHINA